MSRKTLNISNNRKHKKQTKTKSRSKSKTIKKRVRLMFGGREYRSPTKTTKRPLKKKVQQGIIQHGYNIYKSKRDYNQRKSPSEITDEIIKKFDTLVNDISRDNYARFGYEQYELEEIKAFFVTRNGYNIQDIKDVLENKYQEDKENSRQQRNRELEIIEANKALLSQISRMNDKDREKTISILRNNIDPRNPLNPLNHESLRSYI